MLQDASAIASAKSPWMRPVNDLDAAKSAVAHRLVQLSEVSEFVVLTRRSRVQKHALVSPEPVVRAEALWIAGWWRSENVELRRSELDHPVRRDIQEMLRMLKALLTPNEEIIRLGMKRPFRGGVVPGIHHKDGRNSPAFGDGQQVVHEAAVDHGRMHDQIRIEPVNHRLHLDRGDGIQPSLD